MPSPKSGTPGTLVPPTDPDVAHDADDAIPGEVEAAKAAQRQSHTGKYGTQPVQPYTPPKNQQEEDEKPHYIEVLLVDDDDNPVPGEKYRVQVPDGSVKEGSLDQNGFVRINGLTPGNCQVSFPRLDADAWQPA